MSAVSAVKKLVLFSPYAFAFFLLIAFAGLGALYGSVFSPASAAPLVGAGVGVLVGVMVVVGLTEIDEGNTDRSEVREGVKNSLNT